MSNEDTITIPKNMFIRMSTALIKVEKFLTEKEDQKKEWVSGEMALQLLGCKKSKLFDLKKSGLISYKKIGKSNMYSLKSIQSYNQTMSA